MANVMEVTPGQMKALAKRIKGLRYKLLLTQEELADLMGVTGMTICNIETGKFARVSMKTLTKLAKLEQKLTGQKVAGEVMRVPR